MVGLIDVQRPEAKILGEGIEVWLTREEIESLPLIDLWSKSGLVGTAGLSVDQHEAVYRDLDKPWYPVWFHLPSVLATTDFPEGSCVVAVIRGHSDPLFSVASSNLLALCGPVAGKPAVVGEVPLWRVEEVHWHEGTLYATGWMDWDVCDGGVVVTINGASATVIGPVPNPRGDVSLYGTYGRVGQRPSGFVAAAEFPELPEVISIEWVPNVPDVSPPRRHVQFTVIPADMPAPPDAIRAKSSGAGAPASLYLSDGLADWRSIEAAMKDLRWAPKAEDAVAVDFGCGAGRLTQYLSPPHGPFAHVFGVDIDRDALYWASEHLDATFLQGTLQPQRPKELTKGASLVVAVSVFTEASPDVIAGWLEELGKWLNSSGLLLVSFHGPTAAAAAGGRVPGFDGLWEADGCAGLAPSGAVSVRADTSAEGPVSTFYTWAKFESLVPSNLKAGKRWPGQLSGFQDLVALTSAR